MPSKQTKSPFLPSIPNGESGWVRIYCGLVADLDLDTFTFRTGPNSIKRPFAGAGEYWFQDSILVRVNKKGKLEIQVPVRIQGVDDMYEAVPVP